MAKLTPAQIEHIHILAAKMCVGISKYMSSGSDLAPLDYPAVQSPRDELNRYLRSIDIKEQKDD